MKKINTISAFALLGIYATILLHSFIPHFHHSSELKAHEHKTHSHQGHDHTHSSKIEVNNVLAFFSNLLHNHEHQNDEIDTADKYTISHYKVNIPTTSVAINTKKPIIKSEFNLISSHHTNFIERPPILYEDYLNIADPLRGPPMFIS